MGKTNRNGTAYENSLDGINVLIVDDDINCLRILKRHCNMAGYNTSCAMNGDEALSFLKTSPFTHMITDYNMPDMNGLKLSGEAKKIVPELSIIMITGEHSAQLKPMASELGIVDVLSKPLNTSELLAKIRTENIRRGFSQI